MDRQALTTKIIDYSQCTDTASVEQIISNEVHAPALVYGRHFRTDASLPGYHMPSGAFRP
ncbi:hypothetical protein KB20921_27060 [Edwardsiella ictaluri]|nr:hypothetical protein KH20906_26900 [Edwardsiella ictaluri]BEI03445.1 hypothetical protein KB20921_27060 [Edwardsiella ictaluri]BEI06906.1 hypothetical protein KH201010_26920 [Edwardsiella ictaluri]BEI10373.1 hypothetical protein STU22726_27040 [Edwardsiella ictaluri]BEI13852.1 hypothetical protein STU22816_27050 [Edwardsiella ictaluri]